jgi:hypothetical protein
MNYELAWIGSPVEPPVEPLPATPRQSCAPACRCSPCPPAHPCTALSPSLLQGRLYWGSALVAPDVTSVAVREGGPGGSALLLTTRSSAMHILFLRQLAASLAQAQQQGADRPGAHGLQGLGAHLGPQTLAAPGGEGADGDVDFAPGRAGSNRHVLDRWPHRPTP